MVTLRVILEDELPVRLHVVFDPARRSQLRQIPMRKLPCQRREHFFKRCRIVRQINKDETLPHTKREPVQRMLRLIESGNLVHMRRSDQSAIKTVRPRVVGASEGFMKSPVCFFTQERPAMPADIVK